VTQKSKSEKALLLRCTALLCMLLVFAFGALEAVHAHPHSSLASGSSSCAVCVSAHSNAATAVFLPATTLVIVAIVAVPLRAESHTTGIKTSLFIRPPPVTL
jgi:hypothetical protein